MNDREMLIALLEDYFSVEMSHLVDNLIANGVVVREKGEWDRFADEYEICATEFTCPVCKESFGSSEMTDKEFLAMMNFCPNCGADMRIEEQNRARKDGDNE